MNSKKISLILNNYEIHLAPQALKEKCINEIAQLFLHRLRSKTGCILSVIPNTYRRSDQKQLVASDLQLIMRGYILEPGMTWQHALDQYSRNQKRDIRIYIRLSIYGHYNYTQAHYVRAIPACFASYEEYIDAIKNSTKIPPNYLCAKTKTLMDCPLTDQRNGETRDQTNVMYKELQYYRLNSELKSEIDCFTREFKRQTIYALTEKLVVGFFRAQTDKVPQDLHPTVVNYCHTHFSLI